MKMADANMESETVVGVVTELWREERARDAEYSVYALRSQPV